MASSPEFKFFNTGEVAIHYAEWAGVSPHFIFIHGITGTLDTWLGLAPRIARDRGAIAVDLRGHGKSGHANGSYRVEDYARDVESLVESKNAAPVIVIGHSLGAMAALQLAASRPELVSGIVLEDPPLFAREIMEVHDPARLESFKVTAALANSSLSAEEIASRMKRAIPDAPDEYVLERAVRLHGMDGDAVSYVVDQRIDWTPEIDGILRSVQCPVLLQQGVFELGAWMRDSDGARAKKLIPNCTLSVWNETGHSLHSSDPERFVNEINSFVTDHDLNKRADGASKR